MKKIAVLLSGCGVYDGSEIHEAVSALIAIRKAGADYGFIAPDVDQHHVINHLTGEEMNETRNVLIESARIARGSISALGNTDLDQFDALLLPGGFGAAKNLSKWAFQGPAGEILPEVKVCILHFVTRKKPIAALCISPVVLGKALEESGIQSTLTVGTDTEATPYNIDEINGGLSKLNVTPIKKTVREIAVDETNKIVSAPCYMQEAPIEYIFDNATQAVAQLINWIK